MPEIIGIEIDLAYVKSNLAKLRASAEQSFTQKVLIDEIGNGTEKIQVTQEFQSQIEDQELMSSLDDHPSKKYKLNGIN